jgi:hypothetical protein
MSNGLQSRYPDLGKLSLALLEHVTEPVLGSTTQKLLKAPAVERELQESLQRVLVHTEQRFIAECQDEDLRQAVLSLPLADIQSVKEAVRDFYNRPIDSTLSDILHHRLAADFPQLPETRIRTAVAGYLAILRQELVAFSGHVRDPLNALALQDIQKNTAQIVELLKSTQAAEVGNNTVTPTQSVRINFHDHLQLVRDRLQAVRKNHPYDPQRNLLDFYIEPLGSTQPPTKTQDTADQTPQPIGLWELIRPSLLQGRPCILLADFGMGKSWFLESIQYHLANEILKEAEALLPGRIPLRVNLRGFRRESTPSALMPLLDMLGAKPKSRGVLEQLRSQAWVGVLGETYAGRDEANLVALFEEGNFLFLLDALDEISMSSKEETDSILTEIGSLSTRARRSPILVTCRRSFFRNAAQEKSLVDRGFDVFYLWPWSREQILQYLEKVFAVGLLPTNPHDVLRRIEQTHDLRDISSRAMLSAMLVSQWSELSLDQVIDVPVLYEHYIEKALLDWQSNKAWQIERHELARYMEEVAYLMFRLDALSISPSELDEYFSGKFSQLGVAKFSAFAESLVRDIKTNSFLLREGDSYVFCHTSVWEFLVARKLARALRDHQQEVFQVSNRSLQYRSILNNFLMPMLQRTGEIELLSDLFTESV